MFRHDSVTCDRPYTVGYNLFDDKPTWNLSELLLYFEIPRGMHALVVSTACEVFLEPDESPREKSAAYRVKGKLKRKTVRTKKLKRFRQKRTRAT
jgi:hypothetical protein